MLMVSIWGHWGLECCVNAQSHEANKDENSIQFTQRKHLLFLGKCIKTTKTYLGAEQIVENQSFFSLGPNLPQAEEKTYFVIICHKINRQIRSRERDSKEPWLRFPPHSHSSSLVTRIADEDQGTSKSHSWSPTQSQLLICRLKELKLQASILHRSQSTSLQKCKQHIMPSELSVLKDVFVLFCLFLENSQKNLSMKLLIYQ